MTKPELDQFMKEMKRRMHNGYSLDELEQLEKNNAVEYIFNKDIPIDITQSKSFSLDDCINPETGIVNIENMRRILS